MDRRALPRAVRRSESAGRPEISRRLHRRRAPAGAPDREPPGSPALERVQLLPAVRAVTTQSPHHQITTSRDLGGVSVVVVGAGLAGLTAAYDLMSMGADVVLLDARDRVGGRVWTIHDGFADRQHAEAGGDLIDEDQKEIRELAASFDLRLTRILRGGFGYVRVDKTGRPRLMKRSSLRGWERLA